MAASEGGVFPAPPKRPTIIRQSQQQDDNEGPGPKIPARPAPPLPGGRPPAVLRNQPTTDGDTEKRNSQPVPPRPEMVKPARPGSITSTNKPLPPTPAKPSSGTTSAAVKKRPEITIVAAKPMTEVGFRDNKPVIQTDSEPPTIEANFDTKQDTKVENGKITPSHPAPVPRVSPRGGMPENNENKSDEMATNKGPPLRGPPPPVPRHSMIKPGMNTRHETSESEKVHSKCVNEQAETKSLPAPPPRPTVLRPVPGPPTSSPPKGPLPPPPPSRPPASIRVPPIDPSTAAPPQQLGSQLPPPVPRHRYNIDDDDDGHIETKTNLEEVNKQSKAVVETGDDTNALYSVINKPKRPTIIRPGRPSVKSNTELKPNPSSEIASQEQTDTTKPKMIPSPRLPRKQSDPEQRENAEGSFDKSSNNADNVPEFLRKKLRSTIPTEGSISNSKDVNAPTAGSSSSSTATILGPPPPTKPKPAPPQKPLVASKPSVAAKPSLPTKPITSSELDNTKPPSAIRTSENASKPGITEIHSSINNEKSSGQDESAVKPQMVKRPTIIRPKKTLHAGSVENIAKDSSISASRPPPVQSADDSACSVAPVRPLPSSRRPVSMINIHKQTELEESELQIHTDSFSSLLQQRDTITSKSSENVGESTGPKRIPRPVARTRPATMAFPAAKRPPLPKQGPAIDDTNIKPDTTSSSPPGRPPQRPPAKPSPPIVHKTETIPSNSTDTTLPEEPNTSHRTSIHKIGVSVFPQLKVDSPPSPQQAHESTAPPKPGRRPPPPRTTTKHTPEETGRESSDSSDEEFVSARDRPDRPPAGPTKASPSAPRRNSDDARPARPGPPAPGRPGPPPARPTVATGGEEQGTEESVAELKSRPPRPDGKPQRPMSTPIEPPSKPGPPKSRGPAGSVRKGLPPLPTRPGPGHPLYYHMMQTPHGIALHDYTAQAHDELGFKTGEVILLVRRVDDQWLVGKIDDKEGMFPANFVKVAMPLPGEKLDNEDNDSSDDSEEMFYDTSAEKPDTLGSGPRCRARFDFDGDGPEDLVFEDGDIIRLLERVGLEWRRGELHGRRGLFPIAYVEVIEDLPDDDVVEEIGHVVKTVFDFDGEEGELSFQAGESLKVTHIVNEEWLFGEIGSRKGQFPVQFVDHVPSGLPPLDSGHHEIKGGNYAEEPKISDNLSESLVKWDQHDEKAHSPTPVSESPVMTDEPHVHIEYCVALYDYPGETEEDLPFHAGDHIEIVEKIGAEWLKGKIHGRIGIFPVGFVQLGSKVDEMVHSSLESHPESKITHNPSTLPGSEGVAMFDFTGESPEELSFCVGDRIFVEQPLDGATDWSWGTLRGKRGMFPTAFVEI